MNALIAGSTAGLGRALAEKLASEGHGLLLIATDKRDLQVQSHDLHLRFGVPIEYVEHSLDLSSPWIDSVLEKSRHLGPIQALFYPMGYSLDQDRGLLDEGTTRQVMEANFLNIAWMTARFLPMLLENGQGHIIGFGSIASIRGRKANIIYSAAKRALASYFESLRHMTAGTRIRVQFYQLGYMDTQQSFGKKLLFPKVTPNWVANQVVRRLGRDFGVAYCPAYWRLIAILVRYLPWPLYKRLNF